eukprot:CAMPEP_0197640084 /NCGR_PEP_ID=MMETSP1338-20131121/14497_1 /TAXON_ID=43686 ORGANISM="Pelagodinium beii, Strain RCC1491" /NCGR_SAMPLE_ID=MMETSP1338 /ASSEMBLY_ACC=CAM_ASM_000754 /LENGTH=244 /DNA_ID=CAMNT_0043212897 /DNA_START=46 /DNA_END=777 /DNA_ORIENTATION=-
MTLPASLSSEEPKPSSIWTSQDGAGEEEFTPDLFTDYRERCFEYEGETGLVKQCVLGWSHGFCETVWSEVLPQVVAANGTFFHGRKVLEVGAGCGLLGLLAAHTADSVLLTDGAPQEVALLEENCQFAAPGAVVSAELLEWGAKAAAKDVGRRRMFDVLLGSQVTFAPEAIPLLVETIDFFLADDGAAIIYNDRWSFSSSCEECRSIFDSSLKAHGLQVGSAFRPDGPFVAPPGVLKDLARRDW